MRDASISRNNSSLVLSAGKVLVGGEVLEGGAEVLEGGANVVVGR